MQIHGVVEQVDDETVQLSPQCQNAELVTNQPQEPETQTNGIRAVKRVKLGETTTSKLSKGDAKEQTWIEVIVEKVAT